MNFTEQVAKALLQQAGIAIPKSALAESAEAVHALAPEIGPLVVKAQVPTGKRGKAGGIKLADSPEEAAAAAAAILGMEIAGHRVGQVLLEARVDIARELYAAVLNNTEAGCPLVIYSAKGGMDIEELAANEPSALRHHRVDISKGFSADDARLLLGGPDPAANAIAETLAALYRLYIERDAELLEINPLAVTSRGEVIALDCKLVLDDSALSRQGDLAEKGAPQPLTPLEAESREHGLNLIELDGEVGVLANGAGVTMTTMDAVVHYGGRPANFLEIGGEAYTKAEPALRLVLANPRVKSLVVIFCGAFARCDVMVAGVIDAWQNLRPEIPVAFSIHGTGEAEAIAMLRERLGMEPYDLMDDAVKAAVAAAGEVVQ